MSFQFSEDMVRTLKGAPLSCLLILAMERQPVSAQFLERRTGYSDKSVNSALLLLGDMGLATRNARYQWQIAGNATQLPLMNDLLPAPDPEEESPSIPLHDPEKNIQGVGGQDGAGVGEIPTRRISESENFRVPEVEKAENTENNPRESENFRVDCPSSSTRSINLVKNKGLLDSRADTENFRVEVLEIFDEFGVGEPKRSILAGQNWITPRIARYHLETCPDVGLAIWRMEKGWRVPKSWQPRVETVIDAGSSMASTLENDPAQAGSANEVSYPEIPDNQVEAFGRALECLRANMSHGDFYNWFAWLRLARPVESAPSTSSGTGLVVTIRVANDFVTEKVAPYAGEIARLLGAEFGAPVEVKFIVM